MSNLFQKKFFAPGSNLWLYRRMLGYAWPYKLVFLVSLVGMLLFAATAAGFAALMKPLVDEGFVSKNPDVIRAVPLQLVGLFVLRGISSFLGEYSMTWVSRKVTMDLRNAVFAHLLKLPATFYDKNASGVLIAKLIFDVEQIAGSVTEAVFTLVRDGITVILLFGYLVYLNWKLTLLFLVMTPVSMFMLRLMTRGFRRTSQRIQQSMGDISQAAQEAIEGQRIVKAFGGHAFESRHFAAATDKNRRQVLRKTLISVVGMSLIQIVGSLGLALVIWFALADKTLSAGAFVAYIVAVTWMMGPLRRLTKVNDVVQTGLAAAQSAFGVIDEPDEVDTGCVTLARVQGRVEYRDVDFSYREGAPALRRVSFTVEPGQTLALVGSSGSGKTTIANLLPRFYRVTLGEIRLDGVALNDIQLANLRSHIALVGQETLLFDDTIANNIAYGQEEEIDPARLQAAARAAYVLEFSERLPEGLNTRVGEKGLRLSGGQRQRVAIARALYKNAPVLILDEATSALDTESERYVQDAMRRLMKNRTTIVIAHRLSTVEHADQILVLAQGEVVESGNHHDLLAKNGVYANLYRRQFSDT